MLQRRGKSLHRQGCRTEGERINPRSDQRSILPSAVRGEVGVVCVGDLPRFSTDLTAKPPVTYRRRLCYESANDNSPLPAALDRRRNGNIYANREVAMLGRIVTITLLAFSSAALAQQQQCQLECTVTQNGKTRVTRSCHALDAEQCALVAKADTGGPQTCRGYLTTNCVNDR